MMEIILHKALENAIKAEELGVTFYTGLAKKFEKHPELNQTFKLLAKDEVEHKIQFEKILRALMPEEGISSGLGLEFLESIDISKYFDGMDKVDTNFTPLEILTRAFNFEKETVLYYSSIRDIIGESPELLQIINIEKQHAMQLLKIITTDSKFRGISDKWD